MEPGGSWLLPSSRSFAQIAIDIGGSLAKIVWFSRGVKGSPGRLSFKMFETEDMDGVLEFMRGVLDEGIDGMWVEIESRD